MLSVCYDDLDGLEFGRVSVRRRELKFPVVPLLRDLELEIRRLVDDVRVL